MYFFYIAVVFFYFISLKKKKHCCRIFFSVVLVLPCFLARVHVPVGKPEAAMMSNINQMEHMKGEQYSEYSVEINPRPYMSMRDYRNPPLVSAPSYMVPPQYAPPPYPQSTSPMEEAILNLTKLVGNFVEVQKTINSQLSQKIDIMENIVDKRIDGLQSEMEYKLDNLQYPISMLTNQQHVHQEEVNPKEECLIDTTVEEECKHQKEETSPMLTEEGSGKEEIEKPQKSTAQETNSPLPEAPSPDLVYTKPAAHSNPKAPTTKASLALPVLKNLKKLVATIQAYATKSKTLAIAYVAWHSGWFGCWFGFGAPEPQHF